MELTLIIMASEGVAIGAIIELISPGTLVR
jgi:hypothetical protein